MVSLSPNRVRGAEFHRNVWCVTPEKGTKISDVLSPGFFAHVAPQFRVGDHVEVSPEGGDWYAEMLVRSASKLDVTLGVVHVVEFMAVSVSQASESWKDAFYVKWGGPKAKFRIHRTADHEVLEGGFDTAQGAESWIAGHLQAMAA